MQKKFRGKDIVFLARTLAPDLGKKERAIARFIENNPDLVATMGITDISEHLKVSVASITKVSKKLGFSGFHELKINIGKASSLEESCFEIPTPLDDDSYYRKIIESTFFNSILALQESLSVIDTDVVRQVALLFINITDDKKIILAGCGGSGTICDDFHHKLLKIGIVTSVYRDSHLQQMAASLMRAGDILLCISHSGQTTDVISMMKIARENNVKTICITNYPNSPLSLIADYSIISAVRNNPITGENATARIVNLNILDALFTMIASKRNQQSRISLQKTRNAVISKRSKS